jgi:hypothetical protein
MLRITRHVAVLIDSERQHEDKGEAPCRQQHNTGRPCRATHQPPTGTKVALSLFHPYSFKMGKLR